MSKSPHIPDDTAAQLSAEQLARWLADSQDDAAARPTILDVRQRHEWAAGHLPHAIHVPLGQLAKEAAQVDLQRPCVVYCRAGVRSAHGIEILRQCGAQGPLYNLDGGTIAWQAAGQLLVDDSAQER